MELHLAYLSFKDEDKEEVSVGGGLVEKRSTNALGATWSVSLSRWRLGPRDVCCVRIVPGGVST
jgi:hypothetical protein